MTKKDFTHSLVAGSLAESLHLCSTVASAVQHHYTSSQCSSRENSVHLLHVQYCEGHRLPLGICISLLESSYIIGQYTKISEKYVNSGEMKGNQCINNTVVGVGSNLLWALSFELSGC